jgi:hypothetical protein
MTCASGNNHEDLKRDAARWVELRFVGIQTFGAREALELRNCTCGSTLAVEIETASQPQEVS